MWYLQTTAFLLGNTSNMFDFEWVRFVLSLVTLKNWPVGSLFLFKNPLNSYFGNNEDNFLSSDDNFLLDLLEDMESNTFMHRSFNAVTGKTQWNSHYYLSRPFFVENGFCARPNNSFEILSLESPPNELRRVRAPI